MTIIREATPDDLPLIATLVRELADYEGLLSEVSFDQGELGQHLFGEHPIADVLIAEDRGDAVGFALFFMTLSTFKGRPVLYLEDLFVREHARGRGVGSTLLREVARRAAARGCARMEWTVLDWNEPAIRFYKGIGAMVEPDWRLVRVAGPALAEFGQHEL